MDEAKRFLRYATPGALFFGETVGLVYLLLPENVNSFLGTLKVDTGFGFAFALGGVALAGSVGFLLSTVYHAVFLRIDYSGCIRRLHATGRLVLVDDQGQPRQSTDHVDQLSSFIIISSVWHQLQQKSPEIEGVNARAQQLADLAHSIGTAFVGSLFAWLLLFLVGGFCGEISWNCKDITHTLRAHALAIFIIWILYINYCRTSAVVQGFVAESLADVLRLRWSPFRTHDVQVLSLMPSWRRIGTWFRNQG